jgi:hypothetical protein
MMNRFSDPVEEKDFRTYPLVFTHEIECSLVCRQFRGIEFADHKHGYVPVVLYVTQRRFEPNDGLHTCLIEWGSGDDRQELYGALCNAAHEFTKLFPDLESIFEENAVTDWDCITEAA